MVDVPDPIKLPNEREMKCNQELNIYEAQLVARERVWSGPTSTPRREKRILQMKAIVEEQWDEAQDTYDVAANLMERRKMCARDYSRTRRSTGTNRIGTRPSRQRSE